MIEADGFALLLRFSERLNPWCIYQSAAVSVGDGSRLLLHDECGKAFVGVSCRATLRSLCCGAPGTWSVGMYFASTDLFDWGMTLFKLAMTG